MKWAALLNGSGSLLRSIRFMIRWTGKKVSKNNPANAITSFLEIEENRILYIGFELFIFCLFIVKGIKTKLYLLIVITIIT
jgi:hypothetical protein